MKLINLPVLDDQNYKKIFENAKKLIPNLYPKWTDENLHDPGITLLQLLSWLKEMQQFYIDQTSIEIERKLLKLVGVKPRQMGCAKAEISILESSADRMLPKGSRFRAGDTVFETDQSYRLVQNNVAAILSYNDGKIWDMSGVIEHFEQTGYVFGKKMKFGSMLLIGFKKELPANINMNIALDVYENYPVERNTIPEDFDFIPLADVSWEYYSQDGCWRKIDVIRDESYSFLKSGLIEFIVDGPMMLSGLPTDKIDELENIEITTEKLYWIRACLAYSNYDVPPKLRNININTLRTVQKESCCLKHEFIFLNEEIKGTLELDERMALFGEICILGKTGNRFRMLTEYTDYEVVRIPEDGIVKINLLSQSEEGRLEAIRVLMTERRLLNGGFVGKSNGLPRFSVNCGFKDVVAEDFSLMVGEEDASGNMYFFDWMMTDDFTSSKNNDRHYTLEPEAGILSFGDNEFGMSPNASQKDNILITSCAYSFGVHGNVKRGEISEMQLESGELDGISLRFINFEHAKGGQIAETLEDARLRFQRELKQPSRAVTTEDFEFYAKNTPGLMVKRVKSVPAFRQNSNQRMLSQNCVAIIVEPFSTNHESTLSKRYIQNIERYLERFRLITTEVEVIAPQYVGIDIYADISVKPYYRNVKEMLTRLVDDYFNGGEDRETSAGGEFGRDVRYGELYGLLDMNECVNYVKNLSIEAYGPDVFKNANGDIDVPPNSIVYVKNFVLEIY